MLMSCAEPAPVIGRVFDMGSSDMEFLLLQVCTVDLIDDTDDIMQACVWNVPVPYYTHTRATAAPTNAASRARRY
jgi:hypothetical protein